MHKHQSHLALISALLVSACTSVGPDYHALTPMHVGMPDRWAAKLPTAAHAADLARWWTQLDDPVLTSLIEAAKQQNPTLEQALARIRQARADLASDKSRQLPGLTGQGSVTRSGGSARDKPEDRLPLTTTRTGQLDVSWELDLFGGTRRSVESARALVAASEADLHGAHVSLASSVASAYAARRYCEALQSMIEADLASRSETFRLTRLKLDAGFASPADADRTEASVAEAASDLKIEEGGCAATLNQLVALTGLSYADLEAKLAAGRTEIPRTRISTLSSVPADAISQRPDVASVERRLASASAEIGVAKVKALPSLQLLGSIGVNSKRTSGSRGFSESKSVTHPWSFGPQLSLPIFDGGKSAAGIEFARGFYDEALANYKGVVRQAVQEVENALVRVDTIQRREGDVDLASEGYKRFFRATEVQFREGAASLLALEEARRVWLSSQQAQFRVRLEQVEAWIALYKAVGGGWHEGPVASASGSGVALDILSQTE